MIDALLGPVYKWLLLALIVCFGASLWFNMHQGEKLDTAKATMQQQVDKAVAKEMKPYIEAKQIFENNAYELSGIIEDMKNNEAAKTKIIESKLEEVVKHASYRGYCFNSGGVSILNEAGTLKYPP